MGCGNSKLNPEGDKLVPPRIPPLLLRSKLSGFRKRKNGIKLRDGALSKKVLLKDTELEEDNSMLVDNRKSLSSSSPIPLSNNNAITTNQEDDNDTTRVELKQEKTMEDQHNKNIQEEEEAKPVPDNQDNRPLICPGSPSFRVYFVEETMEDQHEDNKPGEEEARPAPYNEENVEMKDEGNGNCNGMEDVSHTKSPSEDSVESTTCAKVGEGQENKTTIKKGKKGMGFDGVITKKRPIGVGVGVGVKNLLNVKSCYHLSCSGNDRANLLSRKAEA